MIKTAQDIKSYKMRLKEALEDEFLRKALDTFNTVYRENRPIVYQGIDFDGIKEEIAAGKDAALSRLTELFEEFKTKAEAAGAKMRALPMRSLPLLPKKIMSKRSSSPNQ